MTTWTIGKPGGPSGPFHSVVSDTGEVIAMQVSSKRHAERIANIPNTATVGFSLGRYILFVNGLVVAMEGDPCRDPHIDGSVWNKKSLDDAAKIINSGKMIE